MQDYPPEAARQLSRLRWTAALLWIIWTVVAVPIYLAYQYHPQLLTLPGLKIGAISLLSLGALWFIYLLYRMGEIARAAGNG